MFNWRVVWNIEGVVYFRDVIMDVGNDIGTSIDPMEISIIIFILGCVCVVLCGSITNITLNKHHPVKILNGTITARCSCVFLL